MAGRFLAIGFTEHAGYGDRFLISHAETGSQGFTNTLGSREAHFVPRERVAIRLADVLQVLISCVR
jgi:hypothetical protein